MLRRSAPAAASGLLATALVLGASAPASAANAVDSLGTQISAALASSGATAVSVRVDVAGRGTVYSRSAAQTLTPASTEKLVTGFVALRVLGTAHRFVTTLGSTAAPDSHGVIHGRLVVRAGGDPTLSTAGLADLSRQLYARGIRKVTGGILLDDTLFSRVRVAPHGSTRLDLGDPGPLSAFAVNANSWRTDAGYRADPSVGNLQSLQKALTHAGITVQGHFSIGRPASTPRVLAGTRSQPLSSIVHGMLKMSDNFYAEMLLEDIGAARGMGTPAGGVRVVRAEAAAMHVSLGGNIDDGSGLSSTDRQSADGEVSWLEAAARDRTRGPILYTALPIGCVDGTLKTRLCHTPYRVHAKTGTLDGMRALSGYVLDAAGHQVTFSFLVAGPLRSAGRARLAIDTAVTAIANSHL